MEDTCSYLVKNACMSDSQYQWYSVTGEILFYAPFVLAAIATVVWIYFIVKMSRKA